MGAAIFSGAAVKILKSVFDLNGNAQILSGTVDPSSSATSAPRGSLYLNTTSGTTYQKQDNGSSTNWSVIASSPVEVYLKAVKNSGTHTANNSYQTVGSWTVSKDTHSAFNSSSGVYTTPVAGDYCAVGAVGFSGSSTGVRITKVRKNSSDSFYGNLISGNLADNYVSFSGSVEDCVASTTTIDVQAFQNSGGNLAYTTTATSTHLTIFRIK